MEKLTYKQNQRDEDINYKDITLQILGAIVVVGLLFVAGNLLLGLD